MDLLLDGSIAHGFDRPAQAGKPTLLLIHGAGLDHGAWHPVIERLPGYGILAPDLPGHGRSGGAPLPDIETMASWILQLQDALRVGEVRLVGHSMGSMIALECAGRDATDSATTGRTRIAGIALLGTAFPIAVTPALLDTAASDEARAQHMVNGWSHATPRHGEGEVSPALAAVMANNLICMQRQPRGALFTDLNACNRYAAGLVRAANVGCPALMLLGEKDRMTPPRGAQELAATIVGVRLLTLPGCGHNMMGEHPEQVAQALMQA